MFEALRGLRDAVAPESGNLGGAGGAGGDAAGADGGASAGAGAGGTAGGGGGASGTAGNGRGVDFEDFFQNYRNGDSETLARIQKVCGSAHNTLHLKRDDLMTIHAKIEREKDQELVSTLANTVLEKSKQIDERVSTLPGMDRTKAQQMKKIQELLESNQQAAQELEEAYDVAKQKRDKVRKFIRDHTCEALGIVETEHGGDENNNYKYIEVQNH